MRQVSKTDTNVRERLEFLLENDRSIESKRIAGRTESSDLFVPLMQGASSNLAATVALGLIATAIVLYAAPDLPSKAASLIPSTTAIQRLFVSPITASKSTITGLVDPVTMSSSFYWTVVLKSNTGQSEEATADIVLPDGAVVSRATLWVNGIPQEAAFNATGAVSTAYENVAHPWDGGLGDPLLVTWSAPNRVRIKASPVPTNGEMQIRLGITAPLHFNQVGKPAVSLPYAENANFNIAQQDVHIESKGGIATPEWFASVDHRSSGRSVLRANPSAEKLKSFVIESERPEDLHQVATRATHAGKRCFIVMTVKDDDGENKVQLTKQEAKPNCKIIDSDHAAYRLSSLWAGQEIERLLGAGHNTEAVEVGTVYRVVSPITGATVLEGTSQYGQYGLHRNRYMVLSDHAQTAAAFAPFVFPSGATQATGASPDSFSAGDAGQITGTQTQSLRLQGASNGTIGPQQGDATVVYGVNSAGTFRVRDSAPYAWVDSLLQTVVDAEFLKDVSPSHNLYGAIKELISWVALLAGTLMTFAVARSVIAWGSAGRRKEQV